MAEYSETDAFPRLLVTAVGSMPHTDCAEAVDLVLAGLSEAPHAPQLSRMDPREQMWIQFTEGLPGFTVDLENLNYYFDTTGDPLAAVEAFYAEYLTVFEGGPADAFAVGREFGLGIHMFLERLKNEGRKRPFVKVQVTGPLSFALTVTDEEKKPIFYHPLFKDVAVKGMGLKAAWLVDQFKPFAENVIVFFDEPSLSAYGSSAFLGVSKEDVIESLDDVIGMALSRGAIPGVHCCGNTDWGLLAETQTRIINFDAVDYMETVPIYASQLDDFLRKGGVFAWGAVPNTDQALKESADVVLKRTEEGLNLLEKAGMARDKAAEKMILTPACGCAGMSMDGVAAVYRILGELDARAGAA